MSVDALTRQLCPGANFQRRGQKSAWGKWSAVEMRTQPILPQSPFPDSFRLADHPGVSLSIRPLRLELRKACPFLPEPTLSEPRFRQQLAKAGIRVETPAKGEMLRKVKSASRVTDFESVPCMVISFVLPCSLGSCNRHWRRWQILPTCPSYHFGVDRVRICKSAEGQCSRPVKRHLFRDVIALAPC